MRRTARWNIGNPLASLGSCRLLPVFHSFCPSGTARSDLDVNFVVIHSTRVASSLQIIEGRRRGIQRNLAISRGIGLTERKKHRILFVMWWFLASFRSHSFCFVKKKRKSKFDDQVVARKWQAEAIVASRLTEFSPENTPSKSRVRSQKEKNHPSRYVPGVLWHMLLGGL